MDGTTSWRSTKGGCRFGSRRCRREPWCHWGMCYSPWKAPTPSASGSSGGSRPSWCRRGTPSPWRRARGRRSSCWRATCVGQAAAAACSSASCRTLGTAGSLPRRVLPPSSPLSLRVRRFPATCINTHQLARSQTAAIGGAAHLVNFRGSDTMAGVMLLRRYYGCPMAGHSIPAAEHSTVTAWGREREGAAFRHLLQQFPSGAVSVVSDSYDIFHACRELWGRELRTLVEERSLVGGQLLIRPDSGDPADTVLKVLNILGKAFGTVVNEKGYMVLPDCLRIIQGDGIDISSLKRVLDAVENAGWSAANLFFGSGGSLLQKVNRDTLNCCFKCSYAEFDGQGVDVYKQPVTDPSKCSKRGQLSLQKTIDGQLVTVEGGKGDQDTDLLRIVFEDGQLLRDFSLEEIRVNAALREEDFSPDPNPDVILQ
ncbi:nicotinamide phosphoribosyltransferase-like isoform X3 [Petromyzon marinus]|uniref:Nicotinamide phosphoribosyltransferase n=1 Tax=Petromyzon marinus TaxID=7757 RepID=A0AAJ7U195_PETMA|nr:nicotinamide phosphoribosyltransferase-like isoform X2 [Petromyzon marinus]